MAITKILKDKIKKFSLNIPTDKRKKDYKNFLLELGGITNEEYEIMIREFIKILEREEKDKLNKIRDFLLNTEEQMKILQNPAEIVVNYYEVVNIKGMTPKDYHLTLKTIFNFAKNNSNKNNRIVFQINGEENYYTLTDAFIDSIGTLRIINNQFSNSGDEVMLRGIYDLENNPILYIKFTSIERTNTYKTSEGAYFPYYCPNYDLEKYQIFKNSEMSDLSDNCLIYALRKLGLDEFKLDLVKTAVNSNYVCKSKLKDICNDLKIIIELYEERNDNTKNKTRKTIYGKTGNTYKIALLDNHYFIYEKYDNTTSLNFIKYLLENKDKYLVPFNYNNMKVDDLRNINISSDILEYDDKAICDKVYVEKDNKYDKIIFGDFETYTENINGKMIHIPYLFCFKYDDEEDIRYFTGINCAKNFINYLNKREDKKILLIFHNAKYDYNFLTKEMMILNEINSDGNFKCLTAITYKKVMVSIKCSYNMLNMSLKKCSEAFLSKEEQKKIKKEVMPYKLYNIEDYVNKRFIPKKDITLDYFKNKDDYKEFFKNATEWGCFNPILNTVDIIEYSKYYCQMDVLILSKCYNKFRDDVLELLKLDINNYLTISSVADAYFTLQGCYEGVKQISLNIQEFILKSVYGGRVMTANNEKIYIEDKINDFDAVSLYPSAMRRLSYPLGCPKVLENLTMEFLRTTDAYFVEIRINKVGIKRAFPLLSHYDENKRNYTNDLEGEVIIVNNITLEDLIKFQEVEFTILRGYYYNEGFNNKIQEVIQNVFNERKRLKKEDNPSEIVYKLLMNSAYGKTIQKPITEDLIFVYGDDRLNSYVSKNYNKITSYRKIPDTKGNKISITKSAYGHYNLAHIGSLILSMSKRIMNEVMCLAEDEGIDIYYQDTDSIHLKDVDISKLEEKFKQTYNRDLIGKNLGQFHSDFKLKGVPDGVDVYSKKLIALGKKCYIDVLEAKDKNNKIYNGFHIRLKGVSGEAITYEANKRGITELDIYERLYKGEDIEFDLTCGGDKACFKFEKNYDIHTQLLFKRKIKF